MRDPSKTLAICLLLVLGGVAAPVAAETPSAAERSRALLEALRTEWEAPAVSGAVAVDGEVVFAAATGKADAAGTPVDPDTRFRIASASKPITAVLVLRLVDQGLLDLDESVRRYVPELPEITERITVRQVLAHTSGIRHYEPDETSHRTEHFDSPLDALAPLLEQPLELEPGTGFLYTTYGYTVIQAVVEAVTGRGFEEALRTFVFEPAGMARSSLDRPGGEESRATGFDRGGPVALDDVSFKYAGGGMVSTPTDLVRLCAAIDRGDLLKPVSRESLLHPAFPEANETQTLGFGVKREITTGLLRNWHPGRGNGFEAYLLCYPEERVAAAVVTNQSWTDPWNEVGRAAETLARLHLPAIYLYRTPPQVLVARLENLVEEGRVDEAVATYQTYRREAEEGWAAGLDVHRLAERLTREGSLKAAAALFAENAAAFPEIWQGQLALAESRARLGDVEGASKALETARRLAPEADSLRHLAERLAGIARPLVASPVGEYALVLSETGVVDALPVELVIAEGTAGLEGAVSSTVLSELRVVSVLAGGNRIWVVMSSSYGLVELDLVRAGAEIEGSWSLGPESGPLSGIGPPGGVGEQTEGVAPESAG